MRSFHPVRASIFLSASALLVAFAAPGCAAPEEGDDAAIEEAETEEPLTSCRPRAEPLAKIVSANIHEGGVWNDSDKRERTWATMDAFVSLVTDIDAPVLAVQETVSETSADRLLGRLDAASGKAWNKQDTVGVSPWGIATAIYWRTDAMRLVQSLGHQDLGKLASNGYTIRFHGVLLEQKATGKRFAVFTGKLPWTDAQENFAMAGVLRDRVRDAMAPYPNTVRVLAMDMNAPVGSPTWSLFDADYDDSGSRRPTYPSAGSRALQKRLDYLWVDRGRGPRESCAFLEPVRRSMHFGSDHRFVWGDVYLR
jgi:hypothetical protein